MSEPNPYAGVMLRIDLTSKKIKKERLKEEFARLYLGGRGFSSRVLYDEIGPDVDPLSPENRLVFATGPLSGTFSGIASNRLTIGAKSPLTGILGDANSGGHFAPELKYAGYDALVIQGAAENPVYLWIDDGDVKIMDASHIWRRDILETNKMVKEEMGRKDAHVAAIGVAGENLVPFACVMVNCYRAAGRAGMGSVMGSKRLKAIGVHGTKTVYVSKPDEFETLVDEICKKIYGAPGYKSVSTYGTSALVMLSQATGGLPTRNSQSGIFEGAEKISGEKFLREYSIKSIACHGCIVHCSHFYMVKGGPFAGTYGEGPEFEAFCSYGSRAGNDNLEAILYANTLSNQLGLDCISTGGVITFAMECYEKKVIGKEDVDGLNLEWGNYEAIFELIRKIAYLEGFGKTLAMGVKKMAEVFGKGSEKFAVHTKGLELSALDLRQTQGYGLAYAVASRGGDHLRAMVSAERQFSPERAEREFGTPKAADPRAIEGKPFMVKWHEELMSVADSLPLCKRQIVLYVLRVEDFAKLLSYATGWDVDKKELLKIGERITNLERLFNVREGIDRKDDTLPERFLREPMPEGPAKGHVVRLEPMLDEYYKLRGWNAKTGIPESAKLKELGLN